MYKKTIYKKNKFTFPKKLRLLTFSDFNHVFCHPKQKRMYYITIISRLNKLTYPRLGIMVAKKYIKLAYKRNKIKRLIRESFRLNQHLLSNEDFIVMVYKQIINLDQYNLKSILEQLWSFFIYDKKNTNLYNSYLSI